MQIWGIMMGLAVAFPFHVCLAQSQSPDKTKSTIKSSKTTHVSHINSKSSASPSASTGTTLGKTNFQSALKNIKLFNPSEYNPANGVFLNRQSQARDFALPDYTSNFPTLNVTTIESWIDTQAISQYLTQQVVSFDTFSQAWQPHISNVQNLIFNNLDSIIDVPEVSFQIFTYIQENHLTDNLPDFSTVNLESLYNAENLQTLIEDYAQGMQPSLELTHQLFSNSNTALANVVSLTMDQAVQTLETQGFSFSDRAVAYKDPNAPENSFSFSAQGIDENSIAFRSSIDPSVITDIPVDQNIINLITDTIENGKPLGEFLHSFQNYAQSVSKNALPILLNNLQNNLESDLELTIDIGALSNSYQGRGTYQYIDIILETLANDVGSVTLKKHDLIHLTRMITEGRSENAIGEYILEDVIGFDTDVVGYKVARNVTNSFLSDHFTWKTFATQRSFSGPGAILQRPYGIQNGFYGSIRLNEGEKTSWIVTGSVNNRSFSSTSLLKDGGNLQLRTELQSHSLGFAYIPTIWGNAKSGTNISGFFEVEGLFIRPVSANVLTQTALTKADSTELLQLYNISLEDMDETNRPYLIPMVSGGLNVQQKITNGISFDAFLIAYPGLAQDGNLDQVPKAINVQMQGGGKITIDLERLNTNKNPKKH